MENLKFGTTFALNSLDDKSDSDTQHKEIKYAMRRDNRHHRRSRKFQSVNENSLYRNHIYLLNALRAAQQNRAVRKELLEWFRRNEDELEIMAPFLMQEYYKAIPGRRSYRYETESSASPEDPTQRKAAETQFTNSSVKTLEQKTREAPPPDSAQTATHLVIHRFLPETNSWSATPTHVLLSYLPLYSPQPVGPTPGRGPGTY